MWSEGETNGCPRSRRAHPDGFYQQSSRRPRDAIMLLVCARRWLRTRAIASTQPTFCVHTRGIRVGSRHVVPSGPLPFAAYVRESKFSRLIHWIVLLYPYQSPAS